MKTWKTRSLPEIFYRALAEKRIQTAQGPVSLRDADRPLRLLRQKTVKPREGVGLCFENGRDCLSFYAALAMQRAVAVPLPPGLPALERQRLWKRLGCRWVADETGLTPLQSKGTPPLWPEEIHWVMHSSGSTGVPKAIPLTLPAMVRNSRDVMRTLGLGTDLLHLGSMSQCYTNGLFNSFLLPLLTGGRVLTGPLVTALKIPEYIRLIRDARPQILWVNPTVVAFLRRRAQPGDLASVKVLISCTAPLSQNECLAAEKALRRPVLQSYGLTETLIVTVEKPGRDAQREFSAGIPVAGPRTFFLGKDSTLVIENGAVFPGYARKTRDQIALSLPPGGKPEKTFMSGDSARLARGRLHIEGRRTEVINVQGVKVSPGQIEGLLCRQEGVRSAVAVGRPDGRGSERPVVLIGAARGVKKTALSDLCAERLGRHARPAAIHVVPQLPMTANGKIDRVAALKLIRQRSGGG